MTNNANYNQAKSVFNTGSLIDYFLLNVYVVCQDWLNWNTAWWRGMDPNGDKKKWRYTFGTWTIHLIMEQTTRGFLVLLQLQSLAIQDFRKYW